MKKTALCILLALCLLLPACGETEQVKDQNPAIAAPSSSQDEGTAETSSPETEQAILEDVKAKITAGVDLNARNEAGSSPLIMAASFAADPNIIA